MSNPAAFSVQLPHIALTLRTILEDYLQLKFPFCWEAGNDWFGSMIKKIREAAGENPLAGGSRLVAGEDLAGEALLFGDKTQQPVEGHLLDRLRRGSVELTGDV